METPSPSVSSAEPEWPFHRSGPWETLGQMNSEKDPTDLAGRHTEAESRLASIRELAIDQVLFEGTTEQRLVDAEMRLIRIHYLATEP